MRVLRRLTVLILLFGVLAVSDFANAAEQKEIKMNKTKLTLTEGEERHLALKNTADQKKIKWSSSNKKIAAVTKWGRVVTKKKGKVIITARLKGKKYTCKVTVIKKNTSDVAALKQIIKKQRAAGSTIPKEPDWIYARIRS